MALAAVTSAGGGDTQQASAHSSRGNPNNGDQSGANKVRTPTRDAPTPQAGRSGNGGPAKQVSGTSSAGGGGPPPSAPPAMSPDQTLTGTGDVRARHPDSLGTLARGGIAGSAAGATPPDWERRLPYPPLPPPSPPMNSPLKRTAALTEEGGGQISPGSLPLAWPASLELALEKSRDSHHARTQVSCTTERSGGSSGIRRHSWRLGT